MKCQVRRTRGVTLCEVRSKPEQFEFFPYDNKYRSGTQKRLIDKKYHDDDETTTTTTMTMMTMTSLLLSSRLTAVSLHYVTSPFDDEYDVMRTMMRIMMMMMMILVTIMRGSPTCVLASDSFDGGNNDDDVDTVNNVVYWIADDKLKTLMLL